MSLSSWAGWLLSSLRDCVNRGEVPSPPKSISNYYNGKWLAGCLSALATFKEHEGWFRGGGGLCYMRAPFPNWLASEQNSPTFPERIFTVQEIMLAVYVSARRKKINCKVGESCTYTYTCFGSRRDNAKNENNFLVEERLIHLMLLCRSTLAVLLHNHTHWVGYYYY